MVRPPERFDGFYFAPKRFERKFMSVGITLPPAHGMKWAQNPL
jgi:hypothetical protein